MGAKHENIDPVVVEETSEILTAGTEFNENELKACSISHHVRATLVADGAPEWSMAVIYDNTTRDPGLQINDGSNQIADDVVLVDILNRRSSCDAVTILNSAAAKATTWV